nr:hypothetical protein [Tanacetum cinerariifolium]GEZ65823.1 hypothetical protein [Tanacetum cinerariifolium]
MEAAGEKERRRLDVLEEAVNIEIKRSNILAGRVGVQWHRFDASQIHANSYRHRFHITAPHALSLRIRLKWVSQGQTKRLLEDQERWVQAESEDNALQLNREDDDI